MPVLAVALSRARRRRVRHPAAARSASASAPCARWSRWTARAAHDAVPLLLERALEDESLRVRRQAVLFLAWDIHIPTSPDSSRTSWLGRATRRCGSMPPRDSCAAARRGAVMLTAEQRHEFELRGVAAPAGRGRPAARRRVPRADPRIRRRHGTRADGQRAVARGERGTYPAQSRGARLRGAVGPDGDRRLDGSSAPSGGSRPATRARSSRSPGRSRHRTGSCRTRPGTSTIARPAPRARFRGCRSSCASTGSSRAAGRPWSQRDCRGSSTRSASAKDRRGKAVPPKCAEQSSARCRGSASSRPCGRAKTGSLASWRSRRSSRARTLQVVELTGEPGDVWLMHPWMLHAPSANCSERPRMVLTERIAV